MRSVVKLDLKNYVYFFYRATVAVVINYEMKFNRERKHSDTCYHEGVFGVEIDLFFEGKKKVKLLELILKCSSELVEVFLREIL